MEIITNSEEETQKLAIKFAKKIKRGDIVALYGDLGAGKTVFVKGLAQGLGIKNRITSPTFTFVKTYQKGNTILHHVDLYRTKNIKDLKALSLDEVFSSNTIVVIEWADRIKKYLPKKRWEVYINAENETKRRIKITRIN